MSLESIKKIHRITSITCDPLPFLTDLRTWAVSMDVILVMKSFIYSYKIKLKNEEIRTRIPFCNRNQIINGTGTVVDIIPCIKG